MHSMFVVALQGSRVRKSWPRRCSVHTITQLPNGSRSAKRASRGRKRLQVRMLTPPVLPRHDCGFPCTFGLSLDPSRRLSDERPSPSHHHHKIIISRNFSPGTNYFLFFSSRSTPSALISFRLFLRWALDSIGQFRPPALFSCLTLDQRSLPHLKSAWLPPALIARLLARTRALLN